MQVSFTDAELAFQEEVHRFFTQEYPDDIRAAMDSGDGLSPELQVRWQKILYEKGWAAPNWPEEYGGTGWTPVQKYIFAREEGHANAPYVIPFGINMVGPIIYTFGSEAQKQRFLPDILASNVWWSQGYSEPGAGSDLASLKTRAELVGDHYVVNGTKTWTTLGQHSDWIFCLVRTSTDVARRQEGISFMLIDMKSPGITVQPIILLDGTHEVNEIHFDDVEVPVENLVGEEGRGWSYGKVLLQHERTNSANTFRSAYRLRKLREQAARPVRGQKPLAADPNFMRRLADAEVELKSLEYIELRTLASVASGKAPGPESSFLKLIGTEIQQKIDALYVDAAGYYSLPFRPDQPVGEGNEIFAALNYFNHRKTTIFAGSNEIQRNIIAKHVLGL
jgi:alkylation response protein AidB-like acyl-CoA dehydrogenase